MTTATETALPTGPYTLRELRNIPNVDGTSVRVSGPRFRETVLALDAARCEIEKYRYLIRVSWEARHGRQRE